MTNMLVMDGCTYLALVDEDVGDLVDPGAGPLAVGDLRIRNILIELDLPT